MDGELRYIYAGDKVAAQAYIGEANKQHLKLRNSMRFQDLKIGQRRLQFIDGAIITNTIVHGIKTATIYVPEVGGEEEERKRKCFCSCHLATAVIQRISYGLCCYEFNTGTPSYDILLCIGAKYQLFEGVNSDDFAPHTTGDRVIVRYADDWDTGDITTITQSSDIRITSIPPYGISNVKYYKKKTDVVL